MKKIVLFLFAFCIMSSLSDLHAQCDPPSILWDEDGLLLNWIAKDNADSHIVRYRETGTFVFTEVEIDDDSFFDISFLDNCVEYDFTVQSVCAGETSASTSIYVAAANCGSCYKEYCDPPNKGEFGLTLNYFRFDEVINETDLPYEAYEDFRGDIDRVARPAQEVEVEFRFTENYFYSARVEMYIDYNRNQEFEADENVVNEIVNPDLPYITTFEVPNFDQLNFGISRLRVIVSSTYNTVSPCVSSNYNQSGEVEDYCVLIGELPSACDFDFETTLSNIAPGVADFEWDELLAAQGYNYRFKKTNEAESEWEEFATITTNASLSELDDCEEYEFEVRGVCPFDTSGYKNRIVFNSFCATSINEAELVIENISTYPNPWSESINVSIQAAQSSTIDIYAHNLNGEKITLQENISITNGSNLISFENLNHLSSGVYFLEIVDENNRRKFHKTLKIQ